MKHIDLSPREYSQSRKAADTYDKQQIIALNAERRQVLDSKKFLGRTATRFAAQFYRGELGTNAWQINRHRNAIRARKNILKED